MNQQAIDLVIKTVKTLLRNNNIKESLEILSKEVTPISSDLETIMILLQGRHTGLMHDSTAGLINAEDFKRDRAILSRNILSVVNDMVIPELEDQRRSGRFSSIYTTSPESDLEKIQGPESNLVPINWIYKCIEASKSVCQVVMDDGRVGTGWLLKGGWVMTNAHVIPNTSWVERSKIVFNYEEDLRGSNKKTSTYRLQADGAIFSPILKFDYARIKVIDQGEVPLSTWGFLEVDNFSAPQINQGVSIIQHPKGGKKQIALTKNEIINVDGHKLFYMTDTERGSSGSPVLNQDWKVIALHHAGKTEEDGGLVINSQTGERRGANEGILIKDIMADIEAQR